MNTTLLEVRSKLNFVTNNTANYGKNSHSVELATFFFGFRTKIFFSFPNKTFIVFYISDKLKT